MNRTIQMATRVACAGIFLLTSCSAYGQQYFPPGILGKSHQQDEFAIRWYSKHLTALREPSLWETSQLDLTAEAYRFLYLRSFHHPISVLLVVARDKTATLVSKETNGKGGYEPGRLIRNRTIHLSQIQTESLLTALNELSFWSLPPCSKRKGMSYSSTEHNGFWRVPEKAVTISSIAGRRTGQMIPSESSAAG